MNFIYSVNLCLRCSVLFPGTRFSSHLRYLELPSELITIPVLSELANKCQNLKFLTLDFSSAMQLHEFNDLNSFPCSLKNLTICLSEVIFLEGFMRKVYQSLSSVEVLHLIGNILVLTSVHHFDWLITE